jgi:hypothetical protein
MMLAEEGDDVHWPDKMETMKKKKLYSPYKQYFNSMETLCFLDVGSAHIVHTYNILFNMYAAWIIRSGQLKRPF